MELKRIGWKNGNLVSKATVTIGENIYEVEPEQYSGETPLSAENLKKMEDNTEEAMNGLENSINNVDYKITPIVLFEGSTNGDITLKDDISNYRIIKIYYKDNDGASYCRTIGNYSKENTLKIALDAYYNEGVYFNLKLRMYAITGKTMTGTGQINYEFSDKSISYNNSIVINRIEGYE